MHVAKSTLQILLLSSNLAMVSKKCVLILNFEGSILPTLVLELLFCVTCSASSLLMAKASWSCRSSSPELCGQACSGSAPPEWEPTERLPPRLGADGAEEAGRVQQKQICAEKLDEVGRQVSDKFS